MTGAGPPWPFVGLGTLGNDSPGAAQALGQRAEGEGADHEPELPGPEQRRELRRLRAPFGPEGRSARQPMVRRSSSVQGDVTRKHKDEELDLDRGQSSCVDEPLDVNRPVGCHDHSLGLDSVCNPSGKPQYTSKHAPFVSSATGQQGSHLDEAP